MCLFRHKYILHVKVNAIETHWQCDNLIWELNSRQDVYSIKYTLKYLCEDVTSSLKHLIIITIYYNYYYFSNLLGSVTLRLWQH